MPRPIIGYYNHETGENLTREMNDQEFAEFEESKKPTTPMTLEQRLALQ
jgi:hypothetical protein